jgi:hypothetical protein
VTGSARGLCARALAAAAVLAAAAPGLASIPVDLEERSREGLQHVCRDREPGDDDYVACVEQVGGLDGEYTAAECVIAGLPPACTLDFVPKVRLKGELLLVQDDQARDFSGTPRLETALILDVKAGRRKQTFVEVFDGAEIGHWNAFAETFLDDAATSIQFSNAEASAFNFASDNLADLGDALRAFAQESFAAADLSGAVAVLTSVKRQKPKTHVVHDDPADPLASAARFRVLIEFVRLRP